MNILHVISAPVAGGIEVYVKQMAIELRRTGHQPTIVFISRAVEDGRDLDFERAFLSELQSAGVDYFFIGRSLRRMPWTGAWKILRYCAKKRVHIYHAHSKYGILLGALLRIPRFYTHHNILPGAPIFWFRLFNMLVDHYVGISQTCAGLLRRYTGRAVKVVRNGIDLSRFVPVVRKLPLESSMRCVCVGRIFEQKNYSLLVRSIALLSQAARRRLHISVVGEGPPKLVSALEREILAAGLTQHISLLGNQIDIPVNLGQSHVLLMTSAWEGLPIALLEATASGLPFVATDVGGCGEVAELCGNGIIVPSGDAQGFADALTELLNNPHRIAQLSEAAVQNAGRFSIGTSAKAHLDLYDRALPNHRKPKCG